MTEQEALMVLNAIPGLGSGKLGGLMAYFGTASEVFRQKYDELCACGIVTSGLAANIVHFSKDKFLFDEYNLIQEKGVAVITVADENFPQTLRDIPGAPLVLYVWGQATLLHSASVAMVGSRIASHYGLSIAQKFATDFARVGLTVVSGLARGIDTASHQGCLNAKGTTIAVLGCGLNHVYPRENRTLMQSISQHGAVISEMPMNTPPIPVNFPRRNRIISGLSLATVVVEAAIKSGALITADYALEQGKDVFAIPANIDYTTAQGSNQLIKDGAKVALTPQDVIDGLKLQLDLTFNDPKVQEQSKIYLDDIQMKFFNHLSSEPMHIDELLNYARQNLQTAAGVLLDLELKGIVRQLPGKYYVKAHI